MPKHQFQLLFEQTTSWIGGRNPKSTNIALLELKPEEFGILLRYLRSVTSLVSSD